MNSSLLMQSTPILFASLEKGKNSVILPTVTVRRYLNPFDPLLSPIRFVNEDHEDDDDFETKLNDILKGTELKFNQNDNVSWQK